MIASIDREALLVALVLAPATYSRNRFFDMYKDPDVRRVRRRAAHIRGVVRQVTARDAARGEPRFFQAEADRVELGYEVPSLGLKRKVLLDPLELALVRYAMARARDAAAPPADDPDRRLVEAALARLAPTPAGHGEREPVG